MTPANHDELMEHARRIIRDLRTRLADAEAQRRPEPIAIVGMAFRFPGAGSDPDQLWKMIAEGRDAVTSVPPDRWNADIFFAPDPASPGKTNTTRAAFLEDVRRFDAAFFDITPREAARMDPQQRLFMETAWWALEDAALPREQIAGSDTGVFVGVHNLSCDYQSMQFDQLDSLDAYSATGTAHDMIAGRLAYWLDLHGPALAVNTACSSSLAAVHLACRSLRAGDCTTALAAGVNLLLTPDSTVAASQLQLLSPDGHCRPFDSRADGMGRGEGCGVVVLKKLSAARQSGDRVLAVIRGSAMNQDGRTNGLTAPNGLAQQRVLLRALAEAGVQPADVGYIETHGTGTALGDPVEVEAIASVFGGPTRPSACTLGALKANLGHLEGAAGVAGLIKTVMVLRHRWLPPVANLQQLNPHLAVEGTGLEIPRAGKAWAASNHLRIAGISSFGWSGTNVHVVLEESPTANDKINAKGPWPILISAQTAAALKELAEAFADRLDSSSAAELPSISYTSTVRRTHHSFRMAVLGSDPQECARQLRQRLNPAQMRDASREVRPDKRLALWESGGEVDWAVFFPEPVEVVDLPRYPFQGKEYWLDERAATARPAAAKDIAAGPAWDASAPKDWFYSADLVERELKVGRASRSPQQSVWFLWGRETDLSRQMASAIRSRGDEVVEDSAPGSSARDFLRSDPQTRIVTDHNGADPRYVVYFPKADSPSAVTAEALGVVQAHLRGDSTAQLWFVTEVSQQQSFHADSVTAALHGFCRVVGLEHPTRIGGVIAADAGSALQVCSEIGAEAVDDTVLLRDGHRWVTRLHRQQVRAASPLQLRQDRSYLITGAFGAIGIDVAAWLIDAGARHLVLAGRRDPSLMNKPQMLAQLDSWRTAGIHIQTRVCDVANESQVAAMLAEIDAGDAPLAGLIHAAAAVRFSPIELATAEDVENVFDAKLNGARILDRCTRTRSPEFFVLFSSAAATLGLRNGAIYAAANSALQGVIEERRALGLSALAVEWGAWRSEHGGAQWDLIENSGFQLMSPQSALSGLAALFQENQTRCIVADIDWQILGPALAMRVRDALVSDIVREAEQPAAADSNAAASVWVNALRPLDPIEQRDQLLALVAEETRNVFGMPPTDSIQQDRGLFAMGMDSLMAVRLKRRLQERTGLSLPGTVTLTYPTVAALADYLQTRLFGEQGSIPTSTALSTVDRTPSGVAEMDDNETRAEIEKELAAVQQTLAREQR
ncbi:MAG TPA: SDR family NAD(P)-dependent oxidoreductase [Acidobacteriaceae bacterium]|jgi:acyl transferase domain-containing protein/acyl carrier protein|nr:SDR family NAD(P)-dependent oxidoreductase [Acidobacteriaceae bacterium]